jgi:DNA-binding CsgD family transcriptional regulator
MGEMLGVSPLTIRKHRANMLLRLSLNSASALTAYAIRIFGDSSPSADPSAAAALTLREKEIGLLLIDGHTSKDISRRLEIRELTVRKHRENIRRKLGVHTTAQLLKALKKTLG